MAKKYILGVDVGTGSIKAFAGKVDEAGNIAVLGSGTAATAGIVKGAWINIRDLAAAIKEATEAAAGAAKMPVEKIYLGIGGQAVSAANSIGSIKSFAISAITSEDVERAYRAAATAGVTAEERILHVLPINFSLDGEKIAGEPIGLSGTLLAVETHIVTVSETTISELISALAAIGIPIAGIFANSIACATAFAATAEDDDFLVMDIGAGLTDLALYSEGKIVVSASLPLGGDYITSDIAQGIDVTKPHAEEIKHYYARLNKRLRGQAVMLDCNDYGTTDKQVAYDHLHNIVESRVAEIVTILYDYLEPSLSSYSIKKILLTGGCSLLPSVPESISRIFEVPVRVTSPEHLAPEYAHPANSACSGILSYAAKLAPVKPEPEGGWRSLIRKLKEFI
ncbi:MAG: cell division protein FtsA [Negativicutes bacterium]|nr:cell division protein FtsA [Negativicutes bacterium]